MKQFLIKQSDRFLKYLYILCHCGIVQGKSIKKIASV